MFKMKMSNYDKESGVSIVVLSTDLGEFTGVSRLHEDDRQNASEFFGCEIAELRALIAYTKRQKQITAYQYKAVKDMYINLSQMKEFNKESVEARKIRRKLHELHEEWMQWKKNINSLEYDIKARCAAREAMMKKIHEKGKTE